MYIKSEQDWSCQLVVALYTEKEFRRGEIILAAWVMCLEVTKRKWIIPIVRREMDFC